MKDEIKEMLDDLRNKNSYINDEKILTFDEASQLLDYITNLQTIEQQYSAILSENAELENKITNLQEKNNNLKEDFKRHIDRINELTERNEKAIKMFNNETLNKYYYGMSYEFEINDFKKDMLNILQGSDKDE